MDLALPIIFRWMHILAAVTAVGGVIFVRFVLMPAAKDALPDDARAALRQHVERRWKIIVMICITLLLVSGFYNFATISLDKGKEFAAYHPLFGVKFLAALGVFFLASVMTGRSPAFEKMRADPGKWLAITAGLGVLIILISGVLKNLTPA